MAQENILQLIGKSFDNEKLNFLYKKLGKEAFEGTTANSGDMTVSGWITYLDIKDKPNTDDAWNTIVGSNFLDEKNNKGQNLLIQMLLAFVTDETVSVTDIIDFFKNRKGEDWIKEKLIEPDATQVTACHIIANNKKYAEDFDFSTYREQFKDSNFGDSFYKPIALLIINEQLEAISKIAEHRRRFEEIFNPMPKKITDIPNNSIIEAISFLTNDKLITQLTDSSMPLNYLFSSFLTITNLSFSTIGSALDADNISGVLPEQIGFNYNSYASAVTSDNPMAKAINPAFYILDKLKDDITQNVIDILKKSIPLAIAPVDPDNKKSEGFSPVMIISDLIRPGSDNQSWDNPSMCAILKNLVSSVSVSGDTNFKKFLMFNATLGTVQQLSNNASVNLYGVVNIVFSKINDMHSNWCSQNDKDFDDYADIFSSLISACLGHTDYIDFSAYKYWCSTFNKTF